MAKFVLSHDAQDIDDTIDEVQAARGSEASLSTRLADIVSDFEADQQRQETEIGAVAAQGAKNMLKFNNAAGYTLTTHGRTFEVMADGGIKITGDTPDSSYADFYVSGTWGNRDPIINETEDNCILSFDCAVALQTQNLYIRAVDRRTGSTARTATAKLNQESGFAFPITTVLITVQPDVVLPSGEVTVYPMIRRAEITDASFVPYAPTNRELYEMILALQSGVSAQSAASLMQAGRIDAELTDAGRIDTAEQAAAEPEEEANT